MVAFPQKCFGTLGLKIAKKVYCTLGPWQSIAIGLDFGKVNSLFLGQYIPRSGPENPAEAAIETSWGLMISLHWEGIDRLRRPRVHGRRGVADCLIHQSSDPVIDQMEH